jgi:hypothetical protein
VKRVGLNLGAPGNRSAADGTLFIEVPSVGGPSPDIPVRIRAGSPRWFRRLSAFFEGEMNWVGASGVELAGTLAIRPFVQPVEKAPDTVDAYLRNVFTVDLPSADPQGAFAMSQPYTVRLYFAEPEARQPRERVFSVSLQGNEVLRDFDITRAAGGAQRVIAKEFADIAVHDDLAITLTPASAAPPVLCGVELTARS